MILQCLDSEEREKFKLGVWFLLYAHASVFTCHVMRNVTISSTMGTLCYEL